MSPTLAQQPHQHYGGNTLGGLLNKLPVGAAGGVSHGRDAYRGKGAGGQGLVHGQVNAHAGGAGDADHQHQPTHPQEVPSGMSLPAPSSSSHPAPNDSGYGMSISPGAASVLSTVSSLPPPSDPGPSQTTFHRDFPPPLAPRHWTVLREVGDGSFGTVWLADWHSPLNLPPGTQPPGPSSRAEYKGKQLVAIKRMKKAFDGGWDECMKLKELKSLRQIPMHPNIIPLYDAFLLPSSRELYFVFECMEGNLYQLTKSRKGRPLASGLTASIFYQILAGLHHIHSYGYFHRDMKPENLLITTTGLADYPASGLYALPGTPPEKDVVVIVKLADFGLAREIGSKPPYTEYVSTRWYRAPEVLLRSRDYSVPVDMWALGTILVEVLTLKPLFPGDSEVDQVYKICEVLGDPSTEYGLDERGRVRGGGGWTRGIKMAKDVGFAFPKIPPRTFSSIFDANVVPVQLIDCIQDLLRYEPKARLTTQQCLDHAYFREVAYRFAPYAPAQTHQQPPQPSSSSQYSATGGSNLGVNTSRVANITPSQASPRSLPPSHSHGTAPQPQFTLPFPSDANHPRLPSPDHYAHSHPHAPQLTRNFSISSTLSGASGLSSTYPVQVHPSSASASSAVRHQSFPEGVASSDAQSITSFPSRSASTVWSGDASTSAPPQPSWTTGQASVAPPLRVPAFGTHLARSPSIAPSVTASTFYDGSIFEGIAPTRASSIMSFPVHYGATMANGPSQSAAAGADGSPRFSPMGSPSRARTDSVGSISPPIAGPSSLRRQPSGLGLDYSPPLGASSSSAAQQSTPLHKSGKWGFSSVFSGDKVASSSSSLASPTFGSSFTPSLNPLKRSPSSASIAASASAQALSSMPLDPKKAKKEAERLAKEQEKANRLAKEQAARDRARAVMKKKNQLMQAADPLHNFSNQTRGGAGAPGGPPGAGPEAAAGMGSPELDKGKGRAVMSDRMVQQRMPQIIEDTSRLYVSPSAGQAGGEPYHPGLLSARFKARKRDEDDDVHSISSNETGQSSQYGAGGAGVSGVVPGRGRTFSISSKATSSSDPERRSRNDVRDMDQLHRVASISSLPSASRIAYHHYAAPSTGHSSLDTTLINNMQGLATTSTNDLSWPPPPGPSSAVRSESLSRQRVASPPHHEQRYSPYQLPSVASHPRSPGPTLAPMQFDPAVQYTAAGHLRAKPSPSNHVVQPSSTSVASYHSTPSVLPSYFVQQPHQQGGEASLQLPYLPAMDHEPSSPVPGSTFPFLSPSPSATDTQAPP
ncbi:hypothetical protein JCM1840_001590 [Sporobolomyces johnsonii]